MSAAHRSVADPRWRGIRRIALRFSIIFRSVCTAPNKPTDSVEPSTTYTAYMPHFPAGRYNTCPRQRLSAFFVELSFDYAAGALPANHLLADYCELAVCQRGTFDNGGLYLRCIFFLLLPIRLLEYAQPFGILDARYYRVGQAR